ncbi:MAG TPA: entry exclusion lipoprotein TrbK [Duganella sp.]|uniref:entry exclusion lipoprotein TrbK n=1 Tax=Duganella sp. TaxID=1904440 RepID=UPI002ED2C0D0
MELILARRGGTIITVIAAGLLCAFAYRSLTRVPAPPAPTKANCAAKAIREVADPMERAILSGQCAKQPASGAAPAN